MEKNKSAFLDAKNRKWNLTLTLATVKQIRDELGIDFADLQDGSAFVQLSADPVKFGALLWLICEKQADRAGVNETEFGESIDDLDGAFDALMAAIVNFTRGPARRAVEEVFAQAIKAEGAAADAMIEIIKEKGAEMMTNAESMVRSKLDSGS